MPTFQTYNVTPILPAALEPLREMSFNLWWTWEPAARRLFRHLDPELWNRTNHNFYHLPIREALRSNGKPLISVPILDRQVFARVWELRVGRVSLYLLDTDIPENSAEDRLITAELYGGDLEMRMRQEIVLGIGGVKALSALGREAEVFHMNEGHSAFLSLERIRLHVTQHNLDFYSALQV